MLLPSPRAIVPEGKAHVPERVTFRAFLLVCDSHLDTRKNLVLREGDCQGESSSMFHPSL
jgi:hypothetical protein